MGERFYIKQGEVDDFGIDFTRRMSGYGTGVNFGWFVPAGIAALASSSANNGRQIAVRLGSATGSYVYLISGFVDTSSGQRLFDSLEIHAW